MRPSAGDFDLAVVDGDLGPVAHQSRRAPRLGVVDEGEQVGAWFVGSEQVGPHTGGSGSCLSLVCGLVGAADAGVEA